MPITWTISSIAARRATGDSLVTVGDWSCGSTTGTDIKGARMSCFRTDRGYKIIERDERDGEMFATSEDCEVYQLNAGRLQWYHDTDTYKDATDHRLGAIMQAFHNDPAIKAKYLERVAAHRHLDQLVQGTGWESGRGCAVGCTLDAYDHKRYPIELGIPIQLAYLEDQLFELQPSIDALEWPSRFLTAIPVGADLTGVWPQWVVWMLEDSAHGVIRYAGDRQDVIAAIRGVADLYRKGTMPTAAAAAWAARAARGAASAARGAAGAARAAEAARAARAAEAASAAWAAASAEWGARAAEWAARAAEWTAEGAEWTTAACDKLIALLASAKAPNS